MKKRIIPFAKVQSIGNDFPLVRSQDLGAGDDLVRLATLISDRRFGVGGDGLLVLEGGGAASELQLRMFNSDGTEDFCGNGLRGAALFANMKGLVGDTFFIHHGGQRVPVRVEGSNVDLTLAPASYDPARVPLTPESGERFRTPVYWDQWGLEIEGSALTTGSTHVVIPVDDLPSDVELRSLGPAIESFHLYPARTSVIWTRSVGPRHLVIRIWERGVGETLGCGTGSAAAAVDVARSSGRTGRFRVDNRGGSVVVELDAWDAPVHTAGPAEIVYEGEYVIPEER